MTYLLGGSIGAILAFIFAFPAIVNEITQRGKEKDAPLLVEVKVLWGQTLSRMTMFLLGLLLHVVMGFGFGFFYPVFVTQGWVGIFHGAYSFISLLIYALLFWLGVNLLIFPAIGFGFFGKREGKFVWLEMLIAILFLGVGMWLVVQYYQPMVFV